MPLSFPTVAMNRRSFLAASTAAYLVTLSKPSMAASRSPDLIVETRQGVLQVMALSERALRIRYVPQHAALTSVSPILQAPIKTKAARKTTPRGVRLTLPFIQCEWDASREALSFFDAAGHLLLEEAPGTRSIDRAQLGAGETLAVEQGFVSPPDEYLFGTGCFQDGHLNIRAMPRRLTQVNTQISLPFIMSNKGYGLLWHNTGLSEFNPLEKVVTLSRAGLEGNKDQANVTTTGGNAQVARQKAVFEGQFTVSQGGRHAFMLDIGRKMASRHYVEIDGQVCVDFSNLWLPPTTSFLADLEPGSHSVRVIANSEDAPRLLFDKAQDRTTWRSPVADGVDYVVVAGPEGRGVMEGYRDILGAAPMFPKWAFGYIHCRERFHSSAEILETARTFRERRLPVDVIVQDWQYWGKHGWNAMQFDEEHYPDPKGLVRELHGMDMRFMLSVWSKISRDTELGKIFADKGFYIPQTDWVDFFNSKAAALYWENQRRRLADLGIDAWWQDATEPENDDLVGRVTAAGPGERVRLFYPLQVSRTVYEGQRRDLPQQRVMILTRSAFLGQHRYGAATWSGDIGNGWDTLKRQIPAGLNMAAAGYPYWTVDAGGFFRPGETQYTDPGYHERFIRWFQYATFLPLQRVHGYMTNTEFWHYGEQVETISRVFLEMRYQLLPYIYSLAHQVTTSGMPMIRPFVFDFPNDETAQTEVLSYMFGPALHVAPVCEAGVQALSVYLPQHAAGWYDFWTGEWRPGGASASVAAPLDQIPLHVKAGSILPFGPVLQSTAQISSEPIDIYVYPGSDAQFDLYDDDGLTYTYEKTGGRRIRMTWNDKRSMLTLVQMSTKADKSKSKRQFRLHRIAPGLSPRVPGAGPITDFTGSPIKIRLAVPNGR